MSEKLKRFGDLPLDGKPAKGTWELLPNHEVGYRAEGLSETIRFRGPIVAVEPDALVAAVTLDQEDQTVVTRTVSITGRWKTDGKNRIVFEAAKSGGRTDTLTFRGTWKLNDSNEIVYSYRSEALKTKRKVERELVFKGFWELSDRRHLTYVLSADSESAFRFKGAFQTPSILAKKGEIRFRVGAEVAGPARSSAGSSAARPVVTLFGAWKVGRNLGLSFELDQPGSRRAQVMRFGGEFRLSGAKTLSVSLRSERGAPLGIELILTREFLGGNGELFARLVRSSAETAAEAGGRIRF